MAVFECKSCGGILNVVQGQTTATCEYCGLVQTLPNPDSEEKLRLFRIAGERLRQHEFSAAEGRFRKIVDEYPDEAEAYWGMLLSAYGIEYVTDPATQRRVPTCNRTSHESVFDNPNYLKACECADVERLKVYRREAKEIEDIRTQFLEIVNREEPYHVFICYKETDEDGQRTQDSVMAQEVYDALTQKGYKVFFSRVTLETRGGEKYEPVIYAALTTAKVMLVFGTNYDYFRAPWVRNEWSRYLELMNRDSSRMLIPCYRGIDIADLPREFQRYQAQDMGEIGAAAELVRNIQKHIPLEVKVQTMDPTLSNLFVRGEISLKDGQWSKAQDAMEKVLAIDPHSAEAYLGLAMAQGKCKDRDELFRAYVQGRLRNNPNLERARQFAGPGLKEWLEDMDSNQFTAAMAAKGVGFARRVESVDDGSGKKVNRVRYGNEAVAKNLVSYFRQSMEKGDRPTEQKLGQDLKAYSDALALRNKLKSEEKLAFMWYILEEPVPEIIAAVMIMLISAFSYLYTQNNSQLFMGLTVVCGVITGFLLSFLFDAKGYLLAAVVVVGELLLASAWLPSMFIVGGLALLFFLLSCVYLTLNANVRKQRDALEGQIEAQEKGLRESLSSLIEGVLKTWYKTVYEKSDPKLKQFDAKGETADLYDAVLKALLEG